jgi:hypothetical protein
MMMMMIMWLDYVSELWPLVGLLFIPKVIYDCGEPWWNDDDRGNDKSTRALWQSY